ncbi:MAG: hypothetical protein WCR21_11585, partial [Bacteroidota bacterium]
IKQAYWYLMHTDYAEKLIPQVEEDIHDVKWFTIDEIRSTVLPKTYYTIADLVKGELGIDN